MYLYLSYHSEFTKKRMRLLFPVESICFHFHDSTIIVWKQISLLQNRQTVQKLSSI